MDTYQRLACSLWSYEMDEPHDVDPPLTTVTWETILAALYAPHEGDCTGLPAPCVRCYAESIARKARYLECAVNPRPHEESTMPDLIPLPGSYPTTAVVEYHAPAIPAGPCVVRCERVDLETAKRHHLPITYVADADQCWVVSIIDASGGQHYLSAAPHGSVCLEERA